jgi:hypothetical protein
MKPPSPSLSFPNNPLAPQPLHPTFFICVSNAQRGTPTYILLTPLSPLPHPNMHTHTTPNVMMVPVFFCALGAISNKCALERQCVLLRCSGHKLAPLDAFI